jgi:PIN domain nuclease of toxin-antitoxin system
VNLLLDTHAWLWFHLGDPQLSQAAREQILDQANVKYVSAASIWEVAIKISLGKYRLNVPYGQFMQDAIVGQGFHLLDIAPRHTEVVATLPFPLIGGAEHRDPFDRLLISQAKTDGLSVVSGDAKLPAYNVPIVW